LKLESKYKELSGERKGSKGKLIEFDSLVDHFAANSLPIRAFASSTDGSRKPEKALTKGTKEYFQSDFLPGSWLGIDFGVEVVLDAYRLPCRPNDPWSPQSWDFEVSRDGKSWTLADSRRDLPLPADGRREFFRLSSPRPCKFARVKMVGKNYMGLEQLVVYEFDFKGSVQAS
jgi:hypothetical protein